MSIPSFISMNPYGWLWKKKYRDMHDKDQQCSIVFCGEPGSGKTSCALTIAFILDRGTNNVPRFSVDRIAFSSKEFFNLIKQDFPKGSAIILDDAGLFALSGDALTKEVKEISKIFQSMRHKNYLIIVTLPVLTMLAKGLRQITQNYGEVVSIDRENEQNIVKFQLLQTNSRTGDIYGKSYIKIVKKIHPIYGIPIIHRVKEPFIRIDKPPKALYDEYDKIRKAKMNEFYASSEDRVFNSKGKLKANKPDIHGLIKLAKDNLRELCDVDSRISFNSVYLNWDIIKSGIKITQSEARLIAKGLKEYA